MAWVPAVVTPSVFRVVRVRQLKAEAAAQAANQGERHSASRHVRLYLARLASQAHADPGCRGTEFYGAGRGRLAGLLPTITRDFEQAVILSDLAFCASGLHPIVTRLRIPQFFCDTHEGQQRVFEMAEVAMRPNFAIIDERLSKGEWWYGDRWSIVDAYLNWVWFRVAGTAFEVSDFPNFGRHDENLKQRPSVQRALAVNQEVADKLAALGLAIKFSGPGAVAASKPKASA
jgi:hypothetical protein